MKSISKDDIPKALYQSDIILYGAGITGRRILKLLEPYKIDVKYVIDDDMNKWGNIIEGVNIISYQEFEAKYQNPKHVSIILTTIYGKTVLRRIKEINSPVKIEVYEMYGWLDEEYGLNRLVIGLEDKNEVDKFYEEVSLLRDKWADEESKKVLDGIYAYMCTKESNLLSKICTEEEQYFISEVLAAIHEPLNIVDGGAYIGELYQTIENHHIKLEHWYCFEADTSNYQRLLEQCKRMNLGDCQICIKKGLWEKESKLFFECKKGTISRIVDYETDNQIETISLDIYFENRSCNFIKMDIEGAEYSALCGAMSTIKRDRPILAISIYHSVKDFYRIPQYLMKELQGYKYYVRHHALILSETVLYAIPDEQI